LNVPRIEGALADVPRGFARVSECTVPENRSRAERNIYIYIYIYIYIEREREREKERKRERERERGIVRREEN